MYSCRYAGFIEDSRIHEAEGDSRTGGQKIDEGWRMKPGDDMNSACFTSTLATGQLWSIRLVDHSLVAVIVLPELCTVQGYPANRNNTSQRPYHSIGPVDSVGSIVSYRSHLYNPRKVFSGSQHIMRGARLKMCAWCWCLSYLTLSALISVSRSGVPSDEACCYYMSALKLQMQPSSPVKYPPGPAMSFVKCSHLSTQEKKWDFWRQHVWCGLLEVQGSRVS